MRPATPPRTAPHPSEKDLSVACVARVGDWGGFLINVHGGSPAQVRGHPDHILCVDGLTVAIELKQPGKVPTGLQFKRLRQWRGAGATVGWATTVAEYDQIIACAVDRTGWVNPLEAPGAPVY